MESLTIITGLLAIIAGSLVVIAFVMLSNKLNEDKKREKKNDA